MKKEKTLKICSKGHKYYKSSDCPSCPFCEKERLTNNNFFSFLSAPAQRTLENANLDSLKDLSKMSEKELLSLHGFGPGSLPKLKELMRSAGLTFRTVKTNLTNQTKVIFKK